MSEYKITLSNPDLGRAERKALIDTFDSGRLSLGPRLPEFEEQIAGYAGTKHAVAVNSGTSALHLIVRSLGLGPGDEVITTPFSFVASANCILFERATPVFADIDPLDLNIDPDCFEAAITKRTRAAVIVDVFGQPARWDKIRKIASRHGIKLIEDSCEAIGAEFKGKRAGSFGVAGTFAFYPNKQITCGEGGVITTNNTKIAKLCASMRNQGRDTSARWLQHARLGFNYRISEFQCAMASAQLGRIDGILKKRERVASWYNEALAGIDAVRVPYVRPGVKASWFVYVVHLQKPLGSKARDKVVALMAKDGVQTGLYFSPIHLQPFYKKEFGFKRGDFPVTETISDRSIALPFYNGLKRDEIDYVVGSLNRALSRL